MKTTYSYILKTRSLKMKVFTFILLILVIYILVSYIVLERWYTQRNHALKTSNYLQSATVTFEYIVVHLDLKGSPPNLLYLKSILKMLKDHRVNALLIEYEDMFPYEGKLVNLSAHNCYKKQQLKQFLMTVVKEGFEIIPLVQTFGHLEFALKLEEFKHLREDPKFPDTICPTNNQSQELLRDMLKQVFNFHNNIAPLKHFHVGCDEVYRLKICELCYRRKHSRIEIFTSHIKFLNNVILELNPRTKVLIWDDMIRTIKPMQAIDLRFPNTETVYWDYNADNLAAVHPKLYKYQRMFSKMWVATAYKGADGPTRSLPDLSARFDNHLLWLNFILKYDSNYRIYKFKGIILTGWSRYSHFEPPCELLPTALPSLMLNLILIGKYLDGIVLEISPTSNEYQKQKQAYIQTHIANDFNSALSCQNSIFEGTLQTFQAMACVFDGSDLYVIVQRCTNFRNVFLFQYYGGHDSLLSNKINIEDTKLGYVNMAQVRQTMDMSVGGLKELIMMESQMIESMSNYFDKSVVAEYVVLKVSRVKKNMVDLLQFLNDYYVVKSWPRRPFNISYEWKESSERDLQLLD